MSDPVGSAPAPTEPRPPRQHPVVAGADPIRLGSALFTLVEPHRGHEVAYNRWYERDHFYAGCMIGPWQFAGRRFVATAELKALRPPESASVTGTADRGSYLALYWVLDGHHDEWNRWAVDQVKALHRAGRMFAERDHVHTLLYRYLWSVGTGDDPVPAELALDHPYRGLVATFVDATDDIDRDRLSEWLRREHVPAVLDATAGIGPSTDLVLAWQPLPLLVDAPGDVPRSAADDRRVVLLWFFDREPSEVWARAFAPDGAHPAGLAAAGTGSLAAALAFVPTVPGTDTYTDRLWAE